MPVPLDFLGVWGEGPRRGRFCELVKSGDWFAHDRQRGRITPARARRTANYVDRMPRVAKPVATMVGQRQRPQQPLLAAHLHGGYLLAFSSRRRCRFHDVISDHP